MTPHTYKVLRALILSAVLGGGLVSIVTMTPNPMLWPTVCRPLAIIIVFLLFQWLGPRDRS